jgi:hypothetical protein
LVGLLPAFAFAKSQQPNQRGCFVIQSHNQKQLSRSTNFKADLPLLSAAFQSQITHLPPITHISVHFIFSPPLRVSLILVVGTPQAPHRSALHDLVGGWELSVAASPARGSPPPRPRRRAGAALPVRRDNMTPLPHRHPRVGLPRP